MKTWIAILATVMVLAGLPAAAHHSTAEFDYTKAYRVEGAIKEFQWTNPHSWVQVLVPNDKGGKDEWGFELGAPFVNARMGWRKDSLAAGDKVTVIFCPSRVRARGTLMTIILANGTTLSGIAANFYKGAEITDPKKVSVPPPLE